MSKTLPSQEFLAKTFCYVPETGELMWRFRDDVPPKWNGRYAGELAGSSFHGRVDVVLTGIGRFRAHRLIWKLVHGIEPDEIDHIDGNPLNNRLSNLRSCSRQQNACNTKPRSVSGLKGVSLHRLSGLWRARIFANGKAFMLGYFKSPEEAHAAYVTAAPHYHGAFARVA